MNNEFKDLTIEELALGYVENSEEKNCKCIFCGEIFEDGVIYSSRGKNVTSKRAALEHVYDVHGGAFNSLISLDKQVNGLSESQKTLLGLMYEEADNKEISEKMNISSATVRTHKFNLQKMKREAKILLALLDHVEDEAVIRTRKLYEEAENEASGIDFTKATETYGVNTLHPFFTQSSLK